ncbi:MAG: hypothetical protein ACPGJV_08090 [Bacteriovoracaceae bacterium]
MTKIKASNAFDTPKIVEDSIRLAFDHSQREYPNLFWSLKAFKKHASFKLNRYVHKANEKQIKGFYISLKSDESIQSLSYKFYYSYSENISSPDQVNLLKVSVKKADERASKVFSPCEGFSNPGGKLSGSQAAEVMKMIAREADGYGSLEPDDLPASFKAKVVNIDSPDLLPVEAKRLYDDINEISKVHFEEIVSELDEEERAYYLGQFNESHPHMELYKIYEITKDGQIVGYVAEFNDNATAAIIEDGAWGSKYIYKDFFEMGLMCLRTSSLRLINSFNEQ